MSTKDQWLEQFKSRLRAAIQDGDVLAAVDVALDEAWAGGKAEGERGVNAELLATCRQAAEVLAHDVPSGCWSTGPLTGNPVEDHLVCPGCRALHTINAAIANATPDNVARGQERADNQSIEALPPAGPATRRTE